MATSPKPYIRFTHSKALRKRTLKVLDAIDKDSDPTPHRGALSDLVVELTETGLQFFFLDIVGKLKMGIVVKQTANMGIGGVLRIMAPTIRNIVGRMDKRQLRQVSRYIRQMMG
jgi:hypothetical protein